MQPTLANVFDQLVADGLATPDSLTRARIALTGAVDTTPPWYARVIAGIGAWIATGCLIGFLVIADLVDEKTSAITAGALLIAAGVALRRSAGRETDFTRQLALAVSLAGQILLIVGVRATTESTTVTALVALTVSGILIAIVPDQVHRFTSALIGSIALIAIMASFRLALSLGSLPPLGSIVLRGSDVAGAVLVVIVGYVWRTRLRDRPRETAEMLEPIGYGALVALLGMLVFSSWFVVLEDFTRGSRSGTSAWTLGAGTTIAIAVGLSALVVIVSHEARAKGSTATPILLAVLTLPTPGIIAAVALLLLGFDRRNRILIALAIAFLIKFVSMYYYSLTLTLLQKSVVLVASGLFLLAARTYLEFRHEPGEANQ